MKEEIGELGATLQDETERLSRIRDECEGVSAQVSKQQVQLEDADAELQRSEFHARDLEMDVGQMDRQLVVRSREREDLLVELALLKIQLKRLEERRARGETDLGTFEERIASAQAGFEERKAGLENEIAELRGTAVRAEEARSEAQRLVALERVGLEKLRKRWELLAHKLESLRELAHAEARGQQVKTPNHPSAEDLSAESERIQQMLADQVVRQREEMLAAQEKLREETAQIEEQIERLRVTLADTRSSTATWRQQTEMKGVPMGLIEERESLEAQLRDSVAFIEERRAQLVNIGRELEELQGAVEDAEHRKMNLDGELTMRRADIFKLDREVQDGNAKLGRARAQVGRLNPEATSQLGLKLLKEAKKELGERIIKLVSERGDGLDNQSLRDELRRIGIGNSEAKPKQMNRGGTNSRLASNPRMVPPAPAVRFPSDVDLLARSASEDGIPMHKSPAARPLPPSLKGSRTATPVRTKLGPGKAPTSTEGLALSGNSIAGSRKNLEKEM